MVIIFQVRTTGSWNGCWNWADQIPLEFAEGKQSRGPGENKNDAFILIRAK